MADVITELRRPSTLGAVIFAVVGWLMLIWTFAASNSDQDALRSQLGDSQKRSGQLADELKREREAAGSLAEIAAKRDAADAELRRAQTAAQEAGRARDEAQGQINDLRDRLKSTQAEQAEAARVLKDAASQRDKLLADLDAARQQSDTVKQAFALASDQLAQKNSELATLNGKVQAQQASAAQQLKEQADTASRLAKTQDAIKTLLAQQAQVAQALAQAETQLAQAKTALAGLDAQIEERRKQVAAPAETAPAQP